MATPKKATVDWSTWSISFTLDTPSDYKIIAKATDNALQLSPSLPQPVCQMEIYRCNTCFFSFSNVYTSNLNGAGYPLFSVLPYLLRILGSYEVAHRSLLSIKYKCGNPAVTYVYCVYAYLPFLHSFQLVATCHRSPY
jgi:hypothetical protein